MTSRKELLEWFQRERKIAGNYTGRGSAPSAAERDAYNMTWDKHMKRWVPNIPKA